MGWSGCVPTPADSPPIKGQGSATTRGPVLYAQSLDQPILAVCPYQPKRAAHIIWSTRRPRRRRQRRRGCEEECRRLISMGLEVLFAFVAFGTVSFIWAIAPEKARS